jgi:hypothetical protein
VEQRKAGERAARQERGRNVADIEYQVGRFDRGVGDKHYETFESAWVVFKNRLQDTTTPRWEIYRPQLGNWGPKRDLDGLHDRLKAIFAGADVGHRRIVRGSISAEPKWVMKKVEEPRDEDYSQIVRIATLQIGDEYTWGAAGSEAFDCSGLVVYCVGHATGIWLPHSAEAIRQDPRIFNFPDRSKVLGGDVVFYDASSRLGAGQADHIGIAKNKDTVIDASSTADMVVQRAINANPIIGFGRLKI